MRSWILKSHCLEFLICFFTVLFNSKYVCDNVMFAVCTCKMKVRQMIYFYTIFMQMSVRHLERKMKPEKAALL